MSPRLRFLTGKDVDLEWTWDLDHVATRIRRAHNNTVQKVEFFAPDGSRYSKSSLVQEVMRFPFFKVRLDNQNEYHYHSSTEDTFRSSVKTPAERSLYDFSVSKFDMNVDKAQTSSKLFNHIIERLTTLDQTRVSKTHSPEDVSMIIRDGISKYCLSVNTEKDILLQQLHLVDEALKPLHGSIENAKEKAHVKSLLSGLSFVGIIGAQFVAVQYGTYVAFSWDIMEPITACISLIDAICGYYFWIWSKNSWNLDSIRSYFYERNLQKKQFRERKREYDQLIRFQKQIISKL